MSLVAYGRTPQRRLRLQPLEVQVMEIIWKDGECCVREMVQRLDRKLAYTTVMTTLNRLCRKCLLDRELTGRSFVYRARISGAEWRRGIAGEMITEILTGSQDSRQLLLSCLVDVVGTIHGTLLDELQTKVQQKRKELATDTGDPL